MLTNELKEKFLPIIEELSFSSGTKGDILDRAREALQELLDTALETEAERVASFEYEN